MAEGGEQKLGFGFKIAGKARPKVAVNVAEKQEQRQLITGVAGSVIQAAEPAAAEKQFVIPALQNTYKTGVGKFVPTFVPEASTAAVTGKAEDRYERAAAPDKPSITSFGLEVRQRKDGPADGDGGAAAGGPMVPANQRTDDAKFKADLEALPEEATVEDYESLPVEEFGRALLRGLGWSDGQGVGRKRQVVEPKQIIKRPDRLGLGANPVAPPPDKRPRKMGDKPREDLVAAPTADGAARHRVGLDEKLVPRSTLLPGPQPGKLMRVVAGDHCGLAARVLELLTRPDGDAGPERVRVELLPSGAEVTVSADDLADKGSAAAAAAAAGGGGSSERRQQREGSREAAGERSSRSQRGSDGGGPQQRDGGSSRQEREGRERHRERSRERDRDRDKVDSRQRQRSHERDRSSRQQQQQQQRSSRDSERERDRQQQQRDRDRDRRHDAPPSPSSSSSEEDEDADDRRRQQQRRASAAAAAAALPPHKLWVASFIRVRVVDKRLQGGRLYLKKGTVLDVAPDGTCDVKLEEGGRQVISARQDQLETVVPKEVGAAVMVVAGPHKGRKGRLLQVNISGGAAALQLTGDMEVVRLLLDDVSQFMGHLEEEDG